MVRRAVACAAVLLIATACGRNVHGLATMDRDPAPAVTTATSAPAPPPGPADVLATVAELGEIVGAADVAEEATTTEKVSGDGVEPIDCVSRMAVGTSYAYAGEDLPRMAGSFSRAKGNGVKGQSTVINQFVAVFDDANAAHLEMIGYSGDWNRNCAPGQQVTVTSDGTTDTWTAGPVDPPESSWRPASEVERLTTTVSRRQPTPRSCGRVTAVRGPAVIETMVCSPASAADNLAKTNAVADRIQAKIPV